MKELYELKQKMMDELKDQAREIMKKPRMSAGDLDTINKLVKSIDRTCEIIEITEEEGYSNAGNWRADIQGNYGDQYSRARRRDSRGRYSNNDGRSYGDGMSYGGSYSMDGDLMGMLEERMRHAKSDREMDAIRRCRDVLREG